MVEKSVSKQSEEDLEFRDEVNEERLKILDNYKEEYREESVTYKVGNDSVGSGPKWYKFTRELGIRLFTRKGRWGGRYFYARLAGTGQLLALGGAFSFGPSWGIIVVTLPQFEISFGYVR